MIPTHSKTTFSVQTKSLLQTLERALLLSDGKNNVVTLKTLNDQQIEITSVSPEIGKVTEDWQPRPRGRRNENFV